MLPMGDQQHHCGDTASVRCAVITVSDSRTVDTDTSGKLIRELLSGHGHTITGWDIVPDDAAVVRQRVRELCDGVARQAVILTGGTGIASRDATIEAIESLFEKRLEGFGELFRTLSFEKIGAAAMLSRAVAGICDDTVIFALPGSTNAVKLAMESLILPQLGHIAGLLTRN